MDVVIELFKYMKIKKFNTFIKESFFGSSWSEDWNDEETEGPVEIDEDDEDDDSDYSDWDDEEETEEPVGNDEGVVRKIIDPNTFKTKILSYRDRYDLPYNKKIVNKEVRSNRKSTCGNCDSIIPTNSKFCHECGNPIK
jgi:hypothetical protein